MTYLTLDEMACKDEARTPYPERFLNRFRRLEATFNAIREAWGAPLKIVSGYRTEAYNLRIGGAQRSQHVQGRAADIQPMGADETRTAHDLHELILRLHIKDELPHLGGLGCYLTFVHIDVRPTDGHLARWGS